MAATEKIIVEAENLIGARPGDSVVIEGENGKVAWAIVLVYVIPLVLFFVGYFLGQSLMWRPAVMGIMGFAIGLTLAVIASRRQLRTGREIRFRIVSFAEK